MNERLKNILHTAWNEPRHFFFWLGLLSICGFAAVICGYVAVDTSLPGPTALLAFAALGCILCFLVSLPAFILAWIPPVGRLLARLLRWRFLVLGCLVTLVALFYAVENWRGRRAWQSFKHEREAKGERFDWAGLAKPPVPEDQNFFETPLWDDLHFVETNGVTVWNNTNWQNRVVFDIYGPKEQKAPGTGNWVKGERADLAAWQAYYRGSNNVFAAEGGPATNYFPVAKQLQAPAADILLALSKFETNRQLLITASGRPYARFWANYDAGFGMWVPHLGRVKGCARYLSFHASASLKAGDRQAALEDLRLVFRLMESIRDEPILISHLVRIAMLHLALQPVWEGLADRQWSEADLSLIESELGKLDFLADYEFAMRGERACTLWGVDYIHKVGPSALDQLGTEEHAKEPPADWEKAMGRCLFRLVPSGWFDQNKVSICRVYENYLLPAVDRQRQMVPPAGVKRAEAAMARHSLSPYEVFAGYFLPAVARTATRCAQAQTFTDLARVACALERYRLASGTLPENLAALTPAFIESLPHDIINGQPLKYRRAEDGQFILYSVGWNETDDGGKVELTKNGNPDMNKGDWVWRYPAR